MILLLLLLLIIIILLIMIMINTIIMIMIMTVIGVPLTADEKLLFKHFSTCGAVYMNIYIYVCILCMYTYYVYI